MVCPIPDDSGRVDHDYIYDSRLPSLLSIVRCEPALCASKTENGELKITITHSLKINHAPTKLLDMLVERFQMLNPKWIENERMGRWNR